MSATPPTPNLVRWTPERHDGCALICVPWAGAGAAMFRSWAPVLGADIAVFGVRLPGRESRLSEAPLADVDAIVASLAADVAGLSHDALALFGACSGALVAYELAHVVEGEGRLDQLLVASQIPPSAAARLPPQADEELVARYLADSVGDEPDLIELLRPALAADVRAASRYAYRSSRRLGVALAVFHGADDDLIRPHDLEGWRAETSGPTTIETIDGADHLFRGVAWEALAEAIHRRLITPARARERRR